MAIYTYICTCIYVVISLMIWGRSMSCSNNIYIYIHTHIRTELCVCVLTLAYSMRLLLCLQVFSWFHLHKLLPTKSNLLIYTQGTTSTITNPVRTGPFLTLPTHSSSMKEDWCWARTLHIHNNIGNERGRTSNHAGFLQQEYGYIERVWVYPRIGLNFGFKPRIVMLT